MGFKRKETQIEKENPAINIENSDILGGWGVVIRDTLAHRQTQG